MARARAGEGPTLLEAETYRLLPHSSDDDDRTYRDPAEVAAWEAAEPVGRYRARLTALGLWDEAQDATLWAETQARVAADAAAAEAAPDPPASTLLTHLYAEPAEDARSGGLAAGEPG